MDKEIRKIINAALKRGWKRVVGGKHFKLAHSSGRKLTFSMSPSDRHAAKQVARELERIEREIKEAA